MLLYISEVTNLCWNRGTNSWQPTKTDCSQETNGKSPQHTNTTVTMDVCDVCVNCVNILGCRFKLALGEWLGISQLIISHTLPSFSRLTWHYCHILHNLWQHFKLKSKLSSMTCSKLLYNGTVAVLVASLYYRNHHTFIPIHPLFGAAFGSLTSLKKFPSLHPQPHQHRRARYQHLSSMRHWPYPARTLRPETGQPAIGEETHQEFLEEEVVDLRNSHCLPMLFQNGFKYCFK